MKFRVNDQVIITRNYQYTDNAGDPHTIANGSEGTVKNVVPAFNEYSVAFPNQPISVRVSEIDLKAKVAAIPPM